MLTRTSLRFEPAQSQRYSVYSSVKQNNLDILACLKSRIALRAGGAILNH